MAYAADGCVPATERALVRLADVCHTCGGSLDQQLTAGYFMTVCSGCIAAVIKEKGLSSATLRSNSRKRLNPDDAITGDSTSPKSSGSHAFRRSVTAFLEDTSSPASVEWHGHHSRAGIKQAYQRSRSASIFPALYTPGVLGSFVVPDEAAPEDVQYLQGNDEKEQQQRLAQDGSEQEPEGALLEVPIFHPEEDDPQEPQPPPSHPLTAVAASYTGIAGTGAASTATAALSQNVWDQPFSDLLSGPGFTFGADEVGFFDVDDGFISLGSEGEGSEDEGGNERYMIDGDASNNEFNDPHRQQHSEGGGEGGQRDSLSSLPQWSAGDAGSGSGERMTQRTVEAPPPLVVPASVGATDGGSPSSKGTEQGAAGPSVAGSNGGAGVRVEAAPGFALPSPAASVGAPMVEGIPALQQSPSPWAAAFARVLGNGSGEDDGTEHGNSEQDEAALLPQRACNSESVGSGEGSSDGSAGGGGSPGAPSCNSCAAAFAVHALEAQPGLKRPPAAGAAFANLANIPAGMIGAVTAAETAAVGFSATPSPPRPMPGPGLSASYNAAPQLPAPAAAPLHVALPGLLPSETYLGFVHQLVASVRTATQAAAQACQRHQYSYAAQARAVPVFGGSSGGEGDGGTGAEWAIGAGRR